jgi:hypothetical protein
MEAKVLRTTVLEHCQQKIDAIEQEQDAPKRITNVYGIIGIGKTEAIYQVYEQFKASHYVILLSFDTCSPPIPPASRQTWQNIAISLQQLSMLKQLPEHIPNENPENPELNFASNLADPAPAAALSRPILLLLDGLDELPYWKWLQEQLIKPLLEYKQCFILASSRSPLGWHFWELNEHNSLYELDAFTLAETRAFLQPAMLDQRTEELQQLTGGYPLGLAYAIDLLSGMENSELTSRTIATYQHTMLETLIAQLPEKIRSAYLEDLLQEIATLGQQFDLSSLRRQLAEQESSLLARLPPGRINITINWLSSRGFILYDYIQQKYRLDPRIKSLIPAPPPQSSVSSL